MSFISINGTIVNVNNVETIDLHTVRKPNLTVWYCSGKVDIFDFPDIKTATKAFDTLKEYLKIPLARSNL